MFFYSLISIRDKVSFRVQFAASANICMTSKWSTMPRYKSILTQTHGHIRQSSCSYSSLSLSLCASHTQYSTYSCCSITRWTRASLTQPYKFILDSSPVWTTIRERKFCNTAQLMLLMHTRHTPSNEATQKWKSRSTERKKSEVDLPENIFFFYIVGWNPQRRSDTQFKLKFYFSIFVLFQIEIRKFNQQSDPYNDTTILNWICGAAKLKLNLGISESNGIVMNVHRSMDLDV